MTTATYTAGDAITQAFRMAAITAKDATVEEDDTAYALTVLNRMLKSWQAVESFDWTMTNMTVSVVAQPAQTLSPARPLRIANVNYRQNSIDRPMVEMTRYDYDTLPNKSARGEPTTWFYDRQREAAVLYIWPVPQTISGRTLQITYERELPDLTAETDVLDVPSEYWDAVVANLAAQLCLDYTVQEVVAQGVFARAQASKAEMLASQNTGSLWFGEPQY
jgi:hypothetical protein